MKGNTPSLADTLVMTTGTTSFTYFHNGANWMRVFAGGQIANNDVIPVGASLMINKKGSAGGFSFYREPAPYTLP
jgi:hypothetical protein